MRAFPCVFTIDILAKKFWASSSTHLPTAKLHVGFFNSIIFLPVPSGGLGDEMGKKIRAESLLKLSYVVIGGDPNYEHEGPYFCFHFVFPKI